MNIDRLTKVALIELVSKQTEEIRQLNHTIKMLKGFNESMARQLNHIRDYHTRLNSAITEVTTAEELSH